MAALSPKEQKENRELRRKLEDKFPGGVAWVRAIKERRSNEAIMIEDRTRAHEKDLIRLAASTVPIRVMKNTGATHEITGHPMVIPHILEMNIFPLDGRTDQFPESKPYFKTPMDLLVELVNHPGWGKIFTLHPVEQEMLQIEQSGMTDPTSRELFKELRGGNKLGQQLVPNSQVAAATLAKETNKKFVEQNVEVVEEDYIEEDDDNQASLRDEIFAEVEAD